MAGKKSVRFRYNLCPLLQQGLGGHFQPVLSAPLQKMPIGFAGSILPATFGKQIFVLRFC
jgi:hypothetical protein